MYDHLGQHEKSIEYYKKGFQPHKVAEDRTGEMSCAINIGAAYYHLKKYDKSIECLEKGLEISKAIGNKEGEATAYTNLGRVYTALGQYEKSVKFLNKALDSTNKKEERGLIYVNLGTAAQSHDEFDKAIKYLEQAFEIMKERGVKGKPLAIVLFQLGINYALSPGHNFEKSRYYLLESIKNHEHTREGLKDEFKILLDDQHVKQYKHLSWFSALLGEVDAALCIAERGRAHALKDLMSKKYAIQKRADESHEFKLDESSLFTKQGCNFLFVAILMKKLYSFVTKSGAIIVSPDSTEKFKSSTDISQNLLQDLVKRIFKSSHFRQQGECEDRSLSKFCVAESPAFEEQADETMGHLRGEDKDGQEERDLEANLCLLYEIIIAPVADLLEGPEIVICPEGHMFRIPFAALKDANGRYLAETFRIRLTPSLTALKLIYDCPANYHSQTGALVVGDPAVGRVEFNGKVGELPSLPEARSEVQMIARLLGVSPLVGEEATKEEVLTRIQEVCLVHIAAHGDAERGEIAFAPNKSCRGIAKKEDFMLTMEDVAKVGIRAKLVVLSCCHSGSGKVLKSEGVVGIARAFLGSGARSVLVSLCAINDAATKAFMNIFYKLLLRDKVSASEALHLSMKKMRESPLYSDIFYWAPFVLIGDDVTLDL